MQRHPHFIASGSVWNYHYACQNVTGSFHSNCGIHLGCNAQHSSALPACLRWPFAISRHSGTSFHILNCCVNDTFSSTFKKLLHGADGCPSCDLHSCLCLIGAHSKINLCLKPFWQAFIQVHKFHILECFVNDSFSQCLDAVPWLLTDTPISIFTINLLVDTAHSQVICVDRLSGGIRINHFRILASCVIHCFSTFRWGDLPLWVWLWFVLIWTVFSHYQCTIHK